MGESVRKNMMCVAASVVTMLGLPLCVVAFAGPTTGMLVSYAMFLVIYPATSVIIGFFAGYDIPARWFQPLLLSAMFVIGSWLAFEMGETDFLIYGGMYLSLGYLSMLLTTLALQYEEWRDARRNGGR